MSQPQNVLLLYPHQLYEADVLPKDVDQIFLIEDPLYFGRDPELPRYLHKQKLVLHRASMRRYVEEVLWPAGYQVEYIEFHHMNESGDIVNKLTHAARVEYFDPTDDVLQRRVMTALQGLEQQPQVSQLESPNFYLTRDEVKNFFQKGEKANFAEFYQWQRERFNILIDPATYKPAGGRLSFDDDSSKRLPKDHQVPGFGVYGSNDFVDEAKDYIEKHFSDNPGNLEDFPWPTNHSEAVQWLDEFLEQRLPNFSTYEDALDEHAPWLYHSGLSPLLNAGLLSPVEVVQRTLDYASDHEVPIASLESFIRRVLGWREFVRGLYLHKHAEYRTSNVFGHHRHMTNDWYQGTTGLMPVDAVIKKVLARGYAQQNERLMVLSNSMFLCEFEPDEVYRWFMELFVDAYDWTVVPNVYAINQHLDGPETAKPYISSSNYILNMSWYEHGTWSDIWDGLYWGFVEKNKSVLAKNPHMRMAVGQLEKLKSERKRIITYRAEDFLNEKTQKDLAQDTAPSVE